MESTLAWVHQSKWKPTELNFDQPPGWKSGKRRTARTCIRSQGQTGRPSNPAVSGRPQIRFAFCQLGLSVKPTLTDSVPAKTV